MSRNPLVFGLFTRMQVVEQVGSGIRRMRDMMVEASLPEPMYKTNGFFVITFKRPDRSHPTSEEHTVMLTEPQKAILFQVRQKPTISFKELMDELHLSRDTINRAFNYFKENGLVAREGTKRKGVWKVLV
jgi:ATP-dependent DNA helicase RecG